VHFLLHRNTKYATIATKKRYIRKIALLSILILLLILSILRLRTFYSIKMYYKISHE
jgi:hypothetical protein